MAELGGEFFRSKPSKDFCGLLEIFKYLANMRVPIVDPEMIVVEAARAFCDFSTIYHLFDQRFDEPRKLLIRRLFEQAKRLPFFRIDAADLKTKYPDDQYIFQLKSAMRNPTNQAKRSAIICADREWKDRRKSGTHNFGDKAIERLLSKLLQENPLATIVVVTNDIELLRILQAVNHVQPVTVADFLQVCCEHRIAANAGINKRWTDIRSALINKDKQLIIGDPTYSNPECRARLVQLLTRAGVIAYASPEDELSGGPVRRGISGAHAWPRVAAART